MNTADKPVMRIGDFIEVPQVQTVIRLDEARLKPHGVTESFVFTADVANHFAVCANDFMQDAGRGCFLQGDFGSGKSHFLAALAAWLSEDEGAERLTAEHDGLASLKKSGRRLLPVAISLVNYRASTPLERIVAGAIEKRLAELGVQVSLSPLSIFFERFRELIREPSLASAFDAFRGDRTDLAAWFASDEQQAYTTAARFLKNKGLDIPGLYVREKHEIFSGAIRAVRAAGFHGLVLLIDELSEFFRSKQTAALLNEDARTLQFLGEMSGSEPLWIIAAVQESVERTGDIAQATFRKIKDRFSLRLYLSTLHIRDLIAKRLIHHKPGADERLFAVYEEYRSHFPSFICEWELFRSIYPVHPKTLSLLEGLGDLFSQHRGIVDFVHARCAGDPARRIPGILDRPATELLAPDSIYDHFMDRLSEFSSFHKYPRQIVPHLDEVIESVLDKEDHLLAKKLIRILVLYAIHPTAQKPDVRTLAELSCCFVASHDPEVNIQFIADAILAPVAENSRFLAREPDSPDARSTRYTIVSHDDHGKILKAKILRAMEEIVHDDLRLILEPISRLAASASWPGTEIMQNPVERTVTWRLTQRRAIAALVQKGGERALEERMSGVIESGKADFGLLIAVGDGSVSSSHTAVWRVRPPAGNNTALREFLALTMIAAELRPSNPADAPLIPLVNERMDRAEQAAMQESLNLIYAGSFDGMPIRIDPAALHIRRFDRLLEAAAEHLLEKRYPDFKRIAPTVQPPSARLYHELFEHGVIPGALTLTDARNQGLSQAMDSLAVPLGLFEVKSGAYRLAPSPGEHAFLTYIFSLFSASGATSLEQILFSMRTGPWGVPQDTAEFLLAALAHCGLISLLRGGKSVPLDFLKLNSVASADAVAPGEIISSADRDTLLTECVFLLPPGGYGSFGLKQQREIWQAVIKLKKSLQTILEELGRAIVSVASYSAFDSFDMDTIQAKCTALKSCTDEIRVSYSAREGLERFCAEWRQHKLAANDVDFVKKSRRFFADQSDYFIFIVHYLRHQSVENALPQDEAVARSHEEASSFLHNPELTVIDDEGKGFDEAFGVFRRHYSACYAKHHERFYKAAEKPALSKYAQRVLNTLRSLAAIRALDRPSGLEYLLAALDTPVVPVCRRSIFEELLRSPVCGCAMKIGDEPPAPFTGDPEAIVRQGLEQYIRILSATEVLEPLSARMYALKDINPKVSERLGRLCAILGKNGIADPAATLDLLDAETLRELEKALSGTTVLVSRPLESLVETLAGRRLTPAKIRAAVDSWLASAAQDAIVSIESSVAPAGSKREAVPGWWFFMRPDIFDPKQHPLSPADIDRMEHFIEEQFPAAEYKRMLETLDNKQIAQFIAGERIHIRAIREAWLLLAQRVVSRSVDPAVICVDSAHLNRSTATAVADRVRLLRGLAENMSAPFPRRLRTRLACVSLVHDPWATREVQAAADSLIRVSAEAGQDWLTTLPAVKQIDLNEAPVVLLIDALAPDVWLEVLSALEPFMKNCEQTWFRLEVQPQTIPAMNALFGLPDTADPADSFAALGITYTRIEGNESILLTDQMTPPVSGSAAVIRLGLIDRALHEGSMRVCDMPELLHTVLCNNLPGLMELCAQHRRTLILTTDHGFSYKNKRVFHGSDTVFERAIIRVVWNV